MSLTNLSDREMIDAIHLQEQELVFSQIDVAWGRALGIQLMQMGVEASAPIAIDVTLRGQCVFHCALEGATPDNAAWIRRKRAVVERFHRSSLYMGAQARVDSVSLADRYLVDAQDFGAFGGSVPIKLRGLGVIGAATVSGLPQVEDHDMVVAALGYMKTRD